MKQGVGRVKCFDFPVPQQVNGAVSHIGGDDGIAGKVERGNSGAHSPTSLIRDGLRVDLLIGQKNALAKTLGG